MKIENWENKSRLGFILIFGLAIILGSIAGFVYKKYEERLWKTQAIGQLNKISDFKTQQVEVWKTDILTDSKEIADSPLLTKAILNWLRNKDAKEKELIKNRFISVLKYKHDHTEILLTDTSGKILISSLDMISEMHLVKNIVHQTIQTKKEVYGDFYKVNTNGMIFLDIAVPVFDTENQIAAVLVFQINPQVNLFPILHTWPDNSTSEEFRLFERKGDSVLFINKLENRPNAVLSSYTPLIQIDNPAVKSVLHGPGTYEGTGSHGQKIIEVIDKVKNSPWFLAARIDQKELFAPVNARLKSLSWLIIGGFLFLSTLLFLIVQYMRRNFFKEKLEEERKQNALKRHYEFVVKYANDIILLEDENLNIIDANQRALEAYQYSLEELKEMEVTKLIAPEERDNGKKRLKEIEKTDGYLVESVHQRKDGTLFDSEISSRLIYVDGKRFFHQVIRDITERKRAEKAIQESELHYHSLTNNAPVGIFRTRLDGDTTYVNPNWCQLSGMSAEQALGDGWLAAVHPEDREKVASGWKNATEHQEVSDKEYRFLKNDGQIVYVIGHTVPETGTDGEITGYVGTITDITNRKEAENKLSLFRRLMDAINDSVEIIDPDTEAFLDVNRIGYEGLGYTREEMLSKTVFDIDPALNKKLAKEIIQELRKSGSKFWEGIHQRKDGSTFPVEVNQQIVKLDHDYMISVARDITERKQAEDILRESEERFRSIYKNSVIGIYRTTPQGQILFCNKKLIQTLGFENFDELSKRDINKEGYKSEYSRFKFKELLERDGFIEDLESEWVKKDGSTVIISEYARLIRDKDGNPLYYDGMALDITDRKNAEENLLKLSKAVEQSPASIIVTDMNGIIEYVNPKFTEITGYNYTEVVGKHFGFLKTGEMTKEEVMALWRDIMSGKEWRGEFHTKKKNGEMFWEQVSISSIKNNQGEITHFVEVSEDITDRKEKDNELRTALEKAQESDTLKTAFLMNMSHEIRTPMNGILGFIGLLSEPDLSDARRTEFIRIVNKSGERLMNTINDIIEISKIEIGDVGLKYENVDVPELIKYYYDFFLLQAKEKGITLAITEQIEGNEALIRTDKLKLDGILMNLLRNAIKFTNKGKIEIGNLRKNGDLCFYVKDTGSGIPEDKLNSIFERFVQADNGLARGYEGSGIGLSIVKAYVEALNGHIEVKSEEGKGSTFTVTIPYQPAV